MSACEELSRLHAKACDRILETLLVDRETCAFEAGKALAFREAMKIIKGGPAFAKDQRLRDKVRAGDPT